MSKLTAAPQARQPREFESALDRLLESPTHSEIQRLAFRTGRSRHEVVGLIFELLIFSRGSSFGLTAEILKDCAESLAKAIGAGFLFWKALGDVDLSEFDAAGGREDAQGENGRPVYFDEALCRDTAARIFRRLGYDGNDGRLIWQVAALIEAGRLSEPKVVDAAEGARITNSKNRIGYFRQVLAESVGGRDQLAELLKLVRRLPKEYSAPPAPAEYSPDVVSLANKWRVPPKLSDAELLREARLKRQQAIAEAAT